MTAHNDIAQKKNEPNRIFFRSFQFRVILPSSFSRKSNMFISVRNKWNMEYGLQQGQETEKKSYFFFYSHINVHTIYPFGHLNR